MPSRPPFAFQTGGDRQHAVKHSLPVQRPTVSCSRACSSAECAHGQRSAGQRRRAAAERGRCTSDKSENPRCSRGGGARPVRAYRVAFSSGLARLSCQITCRRSRQSTAWRQIWHTQTYPARSSLASHSSRTLKIASASSRRWAQAQSREATKPSEGRAG